MVQGANAAPAQQESGNGRRAKLKNNFSKEQVAAWSKARCNTWAIRHSNPNAYYYRFCDVGVANAQGEFNEEEDAQCEYGFYAVCERRKSKCLGSASSEYPTLPYPFLCIC